MRCFKTKAFARFARKNDIDDAALRIARDGKGKSKGFRVLIAFHSAKRTVFLFGFGKNEKGNIDDGELEDAKDIAAAWLAIDENGLDRAIGNGVLIEVQK